MGGEREVSLQSSVPIGERGARVAGEEVEPVGARVARSGGADSAGEGDGRSGDASRGGGGRRRERGEARAKRPPPG